MNQFEARGRIVGIDHARRILGGPSCFLSLETGDGEIIRFGFFGDRKPTLFERATIQGRLVGEFDGAMSLVLTSIEIDSTPALHAPENEAVG